MRTILYWPNLLSRGITRFCASRLIRVTIVNNKSRNGVYVNRERIREESPVTPGDVIKVGSFQIQLLSENHDAVPLTTSGGETVRYLSSDNVPPQKSWDMTGTSLAPLIGEGDERLSAPGQTLSWVYKLFAETPLPQVYEEILNLVEGVVGFDRCYVILFDDGRPDGMDIVAKRTRGPGVEPSGVIVSREILSRVAQSGEAVLVDGSRPFVPSGALS